MNLELFIYDLMSNFLPGVSLTYYLYMEHSKIFDWIISVGDLKREKIMLIVFFISSYLIGNVINFITRKICKIKFISKKISENFKDENVLNYEECKNIIRIKDKDILKIQEIMESKYLLFRNLGAAFIIIIIYRYFRYKLLLELPIVLLFFATIICLIKFVKYWRLCGKNLESLYQKM